MLRGGILGTSRKTWPAPPGKRAELPGGRTTGGKIAQAWTGIDTTAKSELGKKLAL